MSMDFAKQYIAPSSSKIKTALGKQRKDKWNILENFVETEGPEVLENLSLLRN